MEEWSPKKVPYATYDKEGVVSDSSDDSDASDTEGSDDECESRKAVSAESVDIDADDAGLEFGVGDDEVGFKFKGPEPTLHGDWQHKGRCTDF